MTSFPLSIKALTAKWRDRVATLEPLRAYHFMGDFPQLPQPVREKIALLLRSVKRSEDGKRLLLSFMLTQDPETGTLVFPFDVKEVEGPYRRFRVSVFNYKMDEVVLVEDFELEYLYTVVGPYSYVDSAALEWTLHFHINSSSLKRVNQAVVE